MMTDDEPFEQFLKDAAAGYGAPRGEVPREAMWQAIRARRATAPTAPAAAPAPARRHPPRTYFWIGMAATLLLGLAIGRLGWQHSVPAVATARQPAVISAPAETQPVPLTPAPYVGPSSPVPAVVPRAQDARTLAGAGRTTYSLVAVRHLADVEALLSSYAAAPADARADSALASWAKALLSNTRLLLDSPAARDPVRERLLADLEAILVQLVQRSPGGNAEEHSSVERTINKTQIIPRLRSAAPAGLHSGTD